MERTLTVRTATKLISTSLAVTSMLFCLLLAMPTVSLGAAAVEGPKSCNVCGMDRTMFAQSRMLITYEGGASVGVCSIHCAAAELKMSKDKAVNPSRSLTIRP